MRGRGWSVFNITQYPGHTSGSHLSVIVVACLERECVAGELMHQSVLKVPKGLQVLFLSSGYAADYVDRLTEMAYKEIVNCRVINWMKASLLVYPPYSRINLRHIQCV